MGPVIVDVSPIVNNFAQQVEHASPAAGMSVCSIHTVRHLLRSALAAIAGYDLRSQYLSGWAYQYLEAHYFPTEQARLMLTTFLNELENFLFETLGERPYYNHFYIELGTGRNITHLTIWRLGDAHCPTTFDRPITRSA